MTVPVRRAARLVVLAVQDDAFVASFRDYSFEYDGAWTDDDTKSPEIVAKAEAYAGVMRGMRGK